MKGILMCHASCSYTSELAPAILLVQPTYKNTLYRQHSIKIQASHDILQCHGEISITLKCLYHGRFLIDEVERASHVQFGKEGKFDHNECCEKKIK